MGLRDRLRGGHADAAEEFDDGGFDDVDDFDDLDDDPVEGDFDDVEPWDDGLETADEAPDDERLDDLEREVESLALAMGEVRDETDGVREAVTQVEETVRKLLEIYEVVTSGVNPFVDAPEGEPTGEGFGLFNRAEMAVTASTDSGSAEAAPAQAPQAEAVDGPVAADGAGDAEAVGDDGPMGDVTAASEPGDDAVASEPGDATGPDPVGEGASSTPADGAVGDAVDGDERAVDDEPLDGADPVPDDDGLTFEDLKAAYEDDPIQWGPVDDGEPEADPAKVVQDLLDGTDQLSDRARADAAEAGVEPAAGGEEPVDGRAVGGEAPAREDGWLDAVDEVDAVDGVDEVAAPAPDDADGPDGRFVPAEIWGSDGRIGGFEFGEHRRPHLASVPSGVAAELLALEWLGSLVDRAGAAEANRALRFYEEVGWLGPDATEELQTALAVVGFDGEPATAATDGGVPARLTPRDHLNSLRYVSRLASLGSRSAATPRPEGRR